MSSEHTTNTNNTTNNTMPVVEKTTKGMDAANAAAVGAGIDDIVHKQNEPSICIPRTFENITWQKVKETFEELFGEGCVAKVDVVKKEHQNGDKFNRVFVHFKHWSMEHNDIRQRLLKGEEIKIVYDEPWFWKCSMSRVPRPTPKRRGPYIEGFNKSRGNGNNKPNRRVNRVQRVQRVQHETSNLSQEPLSPRSPPSRGVAFNEVSSDEN